MITRIRLRCLACRHCATLRVQVGHESDQRVSTVCQECFTPIRLRLKLENPPLVDVEFAENCEPAMEDGPVLNVGSGFVIPRARLHEDKYFPIMDLPRPDGATLEALQRMQPADAVGPLLLDLNAFLGGMAYARDSWRMLRTAYRFSRTGQADRMREMLAQFYGIEELGEDVVIEGAILDFILRALEPLGRPTFERVVAEVVRARQINEAELDRLVAEFRPLFWSRMDEYMDVFDHFFRGYEEFNQTFMYVRRSTPLPADSYAPSTDFEQTRMYYGEAFELLGSHLDVVAGLNNILSGRQFDQLRNITLRMYQQSDKGRRGETLAASEVLSWFVAEYDNRLRNASHHRWLRLSDDRSELTYRDGGDGQVQTVGYANYLYRCCAITAQLMILASVEAAVLNELNPT